MTDPQRPRRWPRFLLIQMLQIPAVAVIVASPHPTAWLVAALWGSLVCCGGTDSRWRWINRLLVLQATVWLVLAALFGLGEG
ncbi:MAG: hypothetical protein H0V44_15465 [Planctomycetes bacterium]|nr:hypothetical protein [Planctomycetota bacterium]